jgi:hypothetical protein
MGSKTGSLQATRLWLAYISVNRQEQVLCALFLSSDKFELA